MRIRMMIPAVVALTFIAFSLSGAADKKFDKKFTAKSGGTLVVETDLGSVNVTGGSANEVVIHVDMKGRSSDLEDFLVSAEEYSGGVRVKGEMKGGWRGKSHDLAVQYTITVPREYALRATTSGGDLEASSLKGKVEGKTSGGSIRVSDIEGRVEMSTSGGDIHAEKISGDLDMSTSGGDVKVSGVKGNADVGTSGGNVEVMDVQGRVEAGTSGGNVKVKVTGPNMGVRAKTSGGNVEIYLGKNVGANIDAGTSGGEVECDLPITMKGKLSESKIQGTVNGGGETVYARTSGGNVRIKAIP